MKKSLFVCKEKEISEGQSKKVSFKFKGRNAEAFVVRFRGGLYAYRNQCRHAPLPLDWGDNDFFSADKKFLVCKNHGAIYLPRTGECVAGPCSGDALLKLEIVVKKGGVYLSAMPPLREEISTR